MIWCRFQKDGRPSYGIVEGDTRHRGRGRSVFRAHSARAIRSISSRDVKLLVPVLPPTFYAIGSNYRNHVIERAKVKGFTEPKFYDRPRVGYRANSALIATGEDIVKPKDAGPRFEYEGELVAVIGKTLPQRLARGGHRLHLRLDHRQRRHRARLAEERSDQSARQERRHLQADGTVDRDRHRAARHDHDRAAERRDRALVSDRQHAVQRRRSDQRHLAHQHAVAGRRGLARHRRSAAKRSSPATRSRSRSAASACCAIAWWRNHEARHACERDLRCCPCVAALFVAPPSPALAQKYPSRPIRVMLPFAAGSVSDVTLRILADKLGARLGTSIVVENQPRAGGTTAALAAKTATPDGYTLVTLFKLDGDQRVAAQGPALRPGRRFHADLGHQHLRQHHRGQRRLEIPHARATCWRAAREARRAQHRHHHGRLDQPSRRQSAEIDDRAQLRHRAVPHAGRSRSPPCCATMSMPSSSPMAR